MQTKGYKERRNACGRLCGESTALKGIFGASRIIGENLLTRIVQSSMVLTN